MSVVYEIRDHANNDKLMGNLFYYKRGNRFYVELINDLDEWNSPFMFLGHIKKGLRSVDSEWSMKWVAQRIIPPDRQNIGSILKENGLKEYDEYKLLVLSHGRCAQDEEFVLLTRKEDLLPEINERISSNIRDFLIAGGQGIYVFFKKGSTRYIEKKELSTFKKEIALYISDEKRFRNVAVSPGGHALIWNDDREITAEILHKMGREVPISYEDITDFIKERTMNTTEVCHHLSCSRQYLNQLVGRGLLTPVKNDNSTKLIMKAEVEREN